MIARNMVETETVCCRQQRWFEFDEEDGNVTHWFEVVNFRYLLQLMSWCGPLLQK